MNITPPKVSDNQEIDLSQISKKIGQSYQSFLIWVFNCFQFIIRNILYFIILGIVGLVLGYFLDKGNKTYNHEIYVNPNFGSTNLLYSKIDLLESKIKERDTLFFKSIGVKNPASVSLIEIEPVVDIYGFVNERTNTVSNAQNTQNFELLKLLSESADINKVINDDLTGRNYGTHLIHITTKGKVTKENLIDPILNYLNNEEFYKKIQKEYVVNINNIIGKNNEVIKQIDIILDEFSSKTTASQKSDKLIYYNENTQLNEIIKTKNNLISTQGSLRLELLSLSKIVNDKSTVLNVKEIKSIFVKMKFIIPVILILGFIFLVIVRSFYKKQLIKFKERV
ncbi:hypothetical protein FLAN108750_13525 [Flavobacterium antarcticum]|uniref:hypothetical protein n=1 Tax=Flavobacterium antarcticum TaxID=271155 RepID=UPI0003B440F6|nr:hypothetical protein [Flavobacterium antarcticum]